MGRLFVGALVSLGAVSCEQLNDERIPLMAVSIDLSNQGLWDTFGVHGIGDYRKFIYTSKVRVPANFSYTYGSATGYGGILLIGGQNVYTGDVAPLAYDLSCPVERDPGVRVNVDNDTYDAVCPKCNSHYNVIEANGAPISGPAKDMKYALSPYNVYPTSNGGFFITQ